MTVEQLRIRFTPARLREPQAWFIPGLRPENWLSEIVEWGVPHSAISLRLVARSLGDRTPIGCLVTVSGKASPRVSKCCQPYGCIAARLYLPVEAQLDPAVEEFELGELFASAASYVWHPVAGLIGFEEDEIRSVGDLLEQLPETEADWDQADPGTTFSPRLVSVEVDRPISIESIMQSARGDIGNRSGALDELPTAPGEGRGASLARIASLPLAAMGSAIDWIASKLPALPKAVQPNWLQRINKWLSTAVSAEWQSARDRELRRLMEMLKNEPDEGLQYALPLDGTGEGRGLARPTARLFRRLVDFRFWSRGGPADPWLITPAMRHELATRYRELADREIRLGRHRRAAYIYANLLGDWAASAAALKTGGYFREAATLYQERLNRPRDAAACLEEDGAWNEAINLYEKLSDHERVGQLYRKLEQHEHAEAAYRKAVARHLTHGDRTAAARLLENELRQMEQALATLRGGWPDSRQAAACLTAEFQLLGRLGRHAAAERRTSELRDQPLPHEHLMILAPLLAQTAQDYPDAQVRSAAADTTRIVVSRRLVQLENAKVQPDHRLLAAIEKLAPEDRLLARDCVRFVREAEFRFAPPPAKPTRRSDPTTRPPELIHTAQLPPTLDWLCGTGTNEHFYAAGYRHRRLILVQGSWTEICNLPQTVSWDAPTTNRQPILLAPCPFDRHPIWIHVRGAPPFVPLTIVSDADQKRLVIRTPAWSNQETVALARAEQGVSWAISAGENLVVSAFSPEGTPIFSREIPIDDFTPLPAQSIPLHARSEGLFFAIGNHLMSVDDGQRVKSTEFDEPIIALSGSPAHTRLRLAVSFVQGGAVFWKDSSRVRRFGDELSQPRTVFTISGHLVAVDASRIEIYRLDRHELKLESAADSPGQPLAVMRVSINEFAILDATALLGVYRIPN